MFRIVATAFVITLSGAVFATIAVAGAQSFGPTGHTAHIAACVMVLP